MYKEGSRHKLSDICPPRNYESWLNSSRITLYFSSTHNNLHQTPDVNTLHIKIMTK